MSGSPQDPILKINRLTKRFGRVTAVDDVSIEIKDGEFITLLGPSGSGKTTLLNMIAGFEFPTGGEILFQDRPIDNLPPEKRNIGLVFQNYALFPHMTVFENVAFPLKMRKMQKKEIAEKVKNVLELVRLSDFEQRRPKQLSGGQQQRIALARAIVFDSPVLLLDEPLGALDKKLREHMQLELKNIHTRLRRTMIYVTHDQEEALVMSDRVALINQGKFEQIGTPDELYEEPANEFVAGFIGESNLIETTVIEERNDNLECELPDGSRHCFPCLAGATPGSRAVFCVRPEKIFFVSPDASQAHVEGVVEQVIYVGETRRYRIRIGPEETLQVREMSTYLSGGKKEGEKVRLSWHGENMKMLSASPGGLSGRRRG